MARKPILREPNNFNDFIHIDDVCSAIEKAIIKPKISSFLILDLEN